MCCRFATESSPKDREFAESDFFLLQQQIPGMIERSLQAAVAFGHVSAGAGEKTDVVLDFLCDLGTGECRRGWRP